MGISALPASLLQAGFYSVLIIDLPPPPSPFMVTGLKLAAQIHTGSSFLEIEWKESLIWRTIKSILFQGNCQIHKSLVGLVWKRQQSCFQAWDLIWILPPFNWWTKACFVYVPTSLFQQVLISHFSVQQDFSHNGGKMPTVWKINPTRVFIFFFFNHLCRCQANVQAHKNVPLAFIGYRNLFY